jgi:hypothetical protein
LGKLDGKIARVTSGNGGKTHIDGGLIGIWSSAPTMPRRRLDT